MRAVIVRYLKASAMAALVLLFIAVVGGLTWLSVQPIKYAFQWGGFAFAIPVTAGTIIFFLWLDRRFDRGR